MPCSDAEISPRSADEPAPPADDPVTECFVSLCGCHCSAVHRGECDADAWRFVRGQGCRVRCWRRVLWCLAYVLRRVSEGRFAFNRLESANARSFNQRAAAAIPKLMASAPLSRADDVEVTTNYANQLFALLDKAKYDSQKLDPKTSEIIANLGGPGEITAEASLNGC